MWHRVKRWWRRSWLADRWWHFGNWFFNWWYPPHDSASPGYGYYGRSKKGRLARGLRYLRHLFRDSRPVHLLTKTLWRVHDWWYPQTKGAYPSYGYYGSGRRSRLALAWRRVRRRLGHSAFGRQCVKVYERLYEWWYPVLDDSYPYSGYYGRRRKSRPAVAWHRFARWVRNSWFGQRYRGYLYRFDVWWYPPSQSSDSHYPHYAHRRVSRPVLAYRRWRRWFRKTWVGREFGWILDEVTFLLVFLQVEVAQALSERRLRRFFSKKQNVAALTAAVLVLVGGYYYGKPQYRHYLETHYARQAEQFMVRGDFARAYLRVRQVMDINPDNVAACRVQAELADWANSPFALYWRQRTVLLAPTQTNRLALASTALKAEPFPYPTAVKTLDEIEAGFRRTANYQMLAGALAIKLGRLTDAEQHYAEALKLQPDNPVTRMSLAVVQLQSRDPKIVADSRITLELLNTDGKLGILPLRSLVAESAAARDFRRAEQVSTQVLTNAQASFGDRMVHLAILHAAGRTNFQTFLKETQQKALEQPVYVGELAAWLNQFGYASQALTWLQGLPLQVSSQGMIPLALADSYVALKKWKELETYLEAERWIGQDHIRIAMLTLAIKNQVGNQGSALAWDHAVRLASDAPTALNTLAQMAWSWGWVAEAEQVLWHAAAKFPKQTWPLTSLQNIYIARRDTPGLRRLYQASMQQDPKDKQARNNFTMVSLLLGKDLPTAHKDATEIYASAPRNPVFASTYAFSLYLQGRSKEGIEVLRALKPEELADPAVAVYYGLLLAAVGETEAAKDYLDKSAKAFLLPEELALVASARKAN
jgi:Flp pilus assembly protein TadD